MIPASFDESTGYLDRPADWTDDQCTPLAVCHASVDERPVIVSCWKITKEEMEEFQKTGRVWLIVHGNTMPPVALSATSPFQKST